MLLKWQEIYILLFEPEIMLSENKMIQNNFCDIL